jgi:hypothetical protein
MGIVLVKIDLESSANMNDKVCEKMVFDNVVEVEYLTITLTRVKGCIAGDTRHAVTCSVTSAVTAEGSRTVGVTDVKDLHAAVWAFADRAENVGARGAGIAWEIEAAVAKQVW